MRALVTGGGGFVGTHWCRALSEAGFVGVVLDCNRQTTTLPDGWEYVQGDVRDTALVVSLAESATRVVHLAAAHHDDGIAEKTYAEVNVTGTANVLAAMVHHGIADLVFTSTVAVYGEVSGAVESTSPAPVSPYGTTKLAAERLIESWSKERATHRAVVLRPAVIVGPGHFANMYSLMKQIDSGLFVRVGAAANVKSLSAVQTVIQAGEWLRQRDDVPFRVANVVSEPQLSSAAIMSIIAAALGRPAARLSVPLSVAMLAATVVHSGTGLIGRKTNISAARIKKLFATETRFEGEHLRGEGFQATATTESAVREMAAWYLNGGRTQPREQRLPPPMVLGSTAVHRAFVSEHAQ